MKKVFLYISIAIFTPYILTANDCNYTMDDNMMETIIESMNNQTEEAKQLNIIKMYLQRLCINTEQMVSIMDVFKSTEFQEKFFLYSKDYITDLEKYNQLKID